MSRRQICWLTIIMLFGILALLDQSVEANNDNLVADSFVFPTDTFKPSPSSVFGSDWVEACHKCGKVKKHCGIDVDVYQVGKEVRASAIGQIKYAGSFGRGWGNCVILEHIMVDARKCTSLYGHICIALGITPGVWVEQGQLLGTIDPGVRPPHLHFGIRLAEYDPLSIRGALYQCNCHPAEKFPEKFVDPIKFIQNYSVGLQVIKTYPDNNAQNVSKDLEIAIILNQPVDIKTIVQAFKLSASSVLIDIAGGGQISYPSNQAIVWLKDQCIIKCRNWYSPGYSDYKVSLGTQLKAIGGASLTEPFVLYFSTGKPNPPPVTDKARINKVILGKLTQQQKENVNLPQIPKATTVFNRYDWVYIYLHIIDLPAKVNKLELRWYAPDNSLFLCQKDKTDTIAEPRFLKGFITGFYRYPGILGDPVGKWRIDIIWNGRIIKTLNFERRD